MGAGELQTKGFNISYTLSDKVILDLKVSEMAVTVVLKKWGNSIGVVIPKEVIEKEDLKVEQRVSIEVKPDRHPFAKFFGTLRTGRPVQEIKDELKKELWGKEL